MEDIMTKSIPKKDSSGTQETNIFANALKRLDEAAQFADIPPEALERLKHPKKMIQVSIPIRMDNGGLRIFQGYRVRHDHTRGPGKRSEEHKSELHSQFH